jgi:hypothetical protein
MMGGLLSRRSSMGNCHEINESRMYRLLCCIVIGWGFDAGLSKV